MARLQVRLTTTGRRSGQPRSVALYAYPDGERLVVVGSWGGKARDPAWAGNLRAEAHATVHAEGKERRVTAHEVGGDERERLWELVCTEFPLYRTYARRTTRTIPLFALEPMDGV